MIFRLLTILAGMVFAVSTAGCGGSGDSTNRNPVASVRIVSGASQTGTVGVALGLPVVVQALDSNGAPTTGQMLGFAVTSGGGSVFVAAATTDAGGQASNQWTLGTPLGAQTLEVRSTSSSNPVVLATITATADADVPAAIAAAGGDGQVAAQSSSLAQPLRVLVKDRYGNPVRDVSVTFSSVDGGVLAPTVLTTDANGLASSTWTLGQSVGAQVATATVAALPPVKFGASAQAITAGPPTKMQLLSGNDQTVAQHMVLGAPLRVHVTNQYGNGVAGISVVFTAATGSGFVLPATATTDASGDASWQGYVHLPGTQGVVATTPGLPPVQFSATVTGTSHPYDGRYLCPMRYAQQVFVVAPSQLLLTIVNGAYVPTVIDYTGATLNEGTGEVVATWGANGHRLQNARMQMTIDASGNATGSGTFDLVNNGIDDGRLVSSGTWTCQRQ